jgi:hypothetical protein
MQKYKRKTERKLEFSEEKMQETKKRVASGENRRRAAESLRTNKCT